MGSVASVYTTGDNDPELEPTQYYRHYFYCDQCGSFDLVPWEEPANHEDLEASRHRLAKAASYVALALVLAASLVLGFGPGLSFGVVTVFGIALYVAIRGLALVGTDEGRRVIADRWGVVGTLLPWALAALAAEALILVAPWRYWISALALGILLVGLLLARAGLGSKIEVRGRRCRTCGATYRHGSPFFTDLEANPRGFTEDDVPRPLGSSYFQTGRAL